MPNTSFDVVLNYTDVSIDSSLQAQKAVLQVAHVVNLGGNTAVNPIDLVSSDVPNAITVGTDDKLLVQNADNLQTNSDFVATIDAIWIT